MLLMAQTGSVIINMDYVARIDIIPKAGKYDVSDLRALIVNSPDVILLTGTTDFIKEVAKYLMHENKRSRGEGFIDFSSEIDDLIKLLIKDPM